MVANVISLPGRRLACLAAAWLGVRGCRTRQFFEQTEACLDQSGVDPSGSPGDCFMRPVRQHPGKRTERVRRGWSAPEAADNALESALARPQQRWHDGQDLDVAALAAGYAFGLVKNHPYRDGNKRIGFLALVTFLGINGFEVDVPEQEVVAEMLMLADGKLSEKQLADWVRSHITPSQ